MIEICFPNSTKVRNNRIRMLVFCVFAFVFSATFAFLSTSNQDKTEAASTKDFRAGNIISDAVMSDYNSMTVDQIQAFLKSKNACNQSADPAAIGASRYENVNITKHGVTYNRRYYFGSASGLYHVKDGHFVCMADESFGGHSAAYVIWDAAQTFKINPKVLIVLLEKEQSLITDKFPYEVQYRAATGYGCPDTAACDSKYYGLEPQLGNAAYLFRTVLNGGWTNFPLGTNYIQYNPNPGCGGSKVKIENLATSALYRYTPYQPNPGALAAGYGVTSDGCGAYGNRNFFLLYSDWFGDPHANNNFDASNPADKAILSRWNALGATNGKLKNAVSKLNCGLAKDGCYKKFNIGMIIWTEKTGAWDISGAILNRWVKEGSEWGNLGYPTSGEKLDEKKQTYQEFEKGRIYWTKEKGTWVVRDFSLKRYLEIGGAKSILGSATDTYRCGLTRGGCYQGFNIGMIIWTEKTGAWDISGAILNRWVKEGSEWGNLGYPTSGEKLDEKKQTYQEFEKGRIYWTKEKDTWVEKTPM